jgi:hypothetical protein
MTQGYFVNLIYLEMTMMEVIIMDRKLHVKDFVEHIQQSVYSICEDRLNGKTFSENIVQMVFISSSLELLKKLLVSGVKK